MTVICPLCGEDCENECNVLIDLREESSWSPAGSAPGLTKRGEPMPQTVDEWKYLAGLYEKQMLEDKETISKLKQRVNVLEQRGR